MSTTAQRDRSLVTGIAWMAAVRWLAQGISWFATLTAARILQPSHYGIIAMAMVPIGLVRMAEDLGLDSVLLQDQSLEGERQARLAGFAVLVGVGFAVIFIALAYPISLFFREPAVALAICGLSPLFVLDALQLVPRAMMQRQLQFRRLAFVWLAQVVFTGGALLAGAALGLGHWALILNSLSGGVAATLLLIYWHPYRIAWPRQLASLAAPLAQGWRVLASRAAYYTYTTSDQTMIGRVLGKDPLGIYSFALTLANLPLQELTSIVTRVVPGIFTQVQNDRAELRRYYVILTEFLCILAFPAAAGIALTADLVVAIALGPQWSAVVEPLRILCIYSAFFAAQSLSSHLMLWTGQFRALMWCSILTAVSLVAGFVFGARYGLSAMAWVWAILFPLSNLPQLAIGFRTVGMTAGDFLRMLGAPLIGCAGMAGVVLLVRAQLPPTTSTLVEFAGAAGAGAVTYALIVWFGFRGQVMQIYHAIRATR